MDREGARRRDLTDRGLGPGARIALGIGCGGGLIALLLLVIAPLVGRPDAGAALSAMALGLLLALVPCAFYAAVPRLLDRYDSEPSWALWAMFAWGALAAGGGAALALAATESAAARVLGPAGAALLATDGVAPVVEELAKAAGVLGAFVYLRREFDGAVDGMVYGTFVGLGFATTENVVYYARAALEGHAVLALAVFLRGVLSPWAHPFYTALVGLGFGLAREAARPAVRWVGPVAGLLAAMILHAAWNLTATASERLSGGWAYALVPLWAWVLGAFLVVAAALVRRKGRILIEMLEDEVARGTLEPGELATATRPWARVRARLDGDEATAHLADVCGRLAFAKWHVERAMRRGGRTISLDLVQPLRAELVAARARSRQREP